jgi:hypothetical protein
VARLPQDAHCGHPRSYSTTGGSPRSISTGCATASRQRASGFAAANADYRRLYEALEPVVGSFCPGLARTPYHVHRYDPRGAGRSTHLADIVRIISRPIFRRFGSRS